MAINILRISAVSRKTGLARSTIYKYIDLGKFPKPINLCGKAVGWLDSDIEEWLNSLIKASSVEKIKYDDADSLTSLNGGE